MKATFLLENTRRNEVGTIYYAMARAVFWNGVGDGDCTIEVEARTLECNIDRCVRKKGTTFNNISGPWRR